MESDLLVWMLAELSGCISPSLTSLACRRIGPNTVNTRYVSCFVSLCSHTSGRTNADQADHYAACTAMLNLLQNLELVHKKKFPAKGRHVVIRGCWPAEFGNNCFFD